MSHTPGPWERRGWLIVNPRNDGLILDGRMKRPKSLFESFVWDSARSVDEQTANINLAECAPELLEKGKKLSNEVRGIIALLKDQSQIVGWPNIACLDQRCTNFDAIIAKAEEQ